MKRFATFVAVVALFAAASLAQAQDDAARKTADIRRLLELSGANTMSQMVSTQLLQQFRASMPGVPADVWADVEKDVTPDAFIELIVPIYDKHFTHEDIKGLIAFYESPVGRKFVSVQPQLTQDSMAAGQQWAQKLVMKVQQRLQQAPGAAPAPTPTPPSPAPAPQR
jgi:hypothetical protein